MNPITALDWRHPLRDFQEAGIARLLGTDAALLADEMGLGPLPVCGERVGSLERDRLRLT